MTETIDQIRAERDRLQAELDAHRAAITPHPFRNTVITPQMLERERAEKKARIDAAIKEGQERETEAKAAREAAIVEEGRQRLVDYEGQAHQRFLNNGGSEADWRAAWPGMKAAWLVEQSATDPREQRIQEAQAKLRASGRYSSF